MKKTTLKLLSFIALSAITTQAKAQGWTASGSQTVTSPGITKVGIGTSTPSRELTVNGDINYTPQTNTWNTRALDGNTPGGLFLYSKQADANGSSVRINSNGGTWGDGSIGFVAGGNIGSSATAFEFQVNNNNTLPHIVKMYKNGNTEFNGKIYYSPQYNTWETREIDGNTPGGLFLYSKQADANGSSVRINSNGGTWGDGSIGFVAGGNIGSSATAFEFQVNNNNTLPHIVKMHKNGNTEFNGKIYYSPQYNTWETREIDGNTPGGLFLYSQQGDANGSSVRINSNGGTWGDGSIGFVAGGNVGSSATAFEFQVNDNNNLAPLVKIKKDGKVAIGDVYPNTPGSYKLYVKDGILTEKLRVANSNDPINWADFVFDEGYELMSIPKLEKFIKKNKHLPEIPTTEDVQKNGIDIAEINAKLLQKVEELTLYIIQQQKEIDAIKKNLAH